MRDVITNFNYRVVQLGFKNLPFRRKVEYLTHKVLCKIGIHTYYRHICGGFLKTKIKIKQECIYCGEIHEAI